MTTRKPPHHSLKEPKGWFDIFFRKRGWLALIAFAVTLVATLIASSEYRTAEAFEREGGLDHGDCDQQACKV